MTRKELLKKIVGIVSSMMLGGGLVFLLGILETFIAIFLAGYIFITDGQKTPAFKPGMNGRSIWNKYNRTIFGCKQIY